MMDELMEDVKLLCADEKNRAKAKFGIIRSMEEGFGVLAQEWQECDEEFSKFSLDAVLRMLRKASDDDISDMLCEMKQTALNTACEAIQIAAVLERFNDHVRRRYELNGHALESLSHTAGTGSL